MIWLVALVLALSVCLFALARRRWSVGAAVQVVLVLLLAAAVYVCLFDLQPPLGFRAVVVVDDMAGQAARPDAAARARTRRSLERVFEWLRGQGASAYDLIAVTGHDGPPDPAEPGRPWSPADRVPDLAGALRAPDPEAALRLAAGRLTGRSGWARLTDLDAVRPARVVVVSNSPDEWRRFVVRDVAGTVAAFQQAGATVDLWENRAGADPAELDVIPSASVLAAELPLREQPPAQRGSPDALTLRLRSVRLRKWAGQTVSWRLRAFIDRVGPDRHRGFALLPDGGAWKADDASAGNVRVAADGTVELVCRLKRAWPLDTAQSLRPGHHLVEAKLTVHGKDLSCTGRVGRYVEAAYRPVVIVAGEGKRFPLPAMAAWTAKQAVQAAWGALGLVGQDRDSWLLPTSIVSELEWVKWMAKEVKGTAKEVKAPFVLVLHDLSRDAFDETRDRLRALVRNGTHVLVSGLPDRPAGPKPGGGVLPALPGLSAYDAAGKPLPKADQTTAREPWVLTRRPRLLFLRDPSRLGRHEFGPTPKGLVPPKARPPLVTAAALQTRVINRVCQELGLGPDAGAAKANGWVQILDVDPLPVLRGQPKLVPLLDDPEQNLWVPSAVSLRVAASPLLPAALPFGVKRTPAVLAGAPAPHELAGNDVLVVFTHDVPQPADASPALAAAAARGALVRFIRLRTPFDDAVRKLAPPKVAVSSLDAYCDAQRKSAIEWAKAQDLPFSAEEVAARLPAPGPECDLWVQADSAGRSPQAQADALAKSIASAVRLRLLAPESSYFRHHRLGRFLDERLGAPIAEGVPPAPSPPEAWAAPLRCQFLRRTVKPWQAVLYASVVESPGRGPTLAPRPVAFGGPAGGGSVLVLGYSIFEDNGEALNRLAKLPTGVPDSPGLGLRRRVYAPGSIGVDHWGCQRVLDLARLHGSLEQSPSHRPRLRRAERRDAGGRLRLEVVRRLDLYGPKPQSPPQDVTLEEAGKPPARARLVDVDLSRQVLVYEMAAAELEGRNGWLKLKLSGEEGGELFVRGGKPTDVDLGALAAVEAVAAYTGGRGSTRLAELPSPRTGTRIWGGIVVVLLLALLWGARWLRRWRRARTAGLRAEAESRRLAGEPSAPSAVAEAGESLGPLVTHLRAGAFAGYRTFEPGDRLALAVPEDLAVLGHFGQPLVPRVIRRVDERTSSLTVVVAMGRSLRQPGAHNGPPKVLAAVLTAEILAEVAWGGGGQVTIQLVGLAAPVAPFGPHRGDPGPGRLRAHILSGLQTPAGPEPPGLPRGLETNARVVYLSDFLTEDRASLPRDVASLEADGGRFGAVLLYSPAEFSLVDLGLTGPPLVLCDRSEWLASDLEHAYRQHARWWGQALTDSRGGLTIVSSLDGKFQVFAGIRDGRLLEVLRG